MFGRRVGWAVAALLCASSVGWGTTYYVAQAGNDNWSGTSEQPWHTIQRAATAVSPGDTVVIGTGVYRESVAVRRGGAAEAPVTFTAAPGAKVIITGADPLRDGWTKAPELSEAVYVHDWPHVFAIDHRNGRPVMAHPADAEHEVIGRAEQVLHHGVLLRQVLKLSQLAPGTFCADVDQHKLYVWLRNGKDPALSDMEASTRSTWLVSGPGVSYVHIRGITFRYAANFAQRGAFSVGVMRLAGSAPARGWVVEDCIFERANGPAASISGEQHRLRRCVFQDNGQMGLGTSLCHDTVAEECGFYRNNTKGFSTGWEAGGLKVTMSRRFVFDRCRAVDNRGVGIWYDIGNEQSEVKGCYIAANDEAGIFYEISYGLHAHDNLIVNNANLGGSPGAAWGNGGITLSSSEDCVIENNTLVGNRDGIAFREQERTTPRLDGRRSVRVLNRNHVIRNNIIAWSGAYNIAFWMDTRFFGPHPNNPNSTGTSEDPRTLAIRLENNLLWPCPGRPNYLYGAQWRRGSKRFETPAEFGQGSGIADSSRVADPAFIDPIRGDYRLDPRSPAIGMKTGAKSVQDWLHD